VTVRLKCGETGENYSGAAFGNIIGHISETTVAEMMVCWMTVEVCVQLLTAQ
jgi:hypothetical protein